MILLTHIYSVSDKFILIIFFIIRIITSIILLNFPTSIATFGIILSDFIDHGVPNSLGLLSKNNTKTSFYLIFDKLIDTIFNIMLFIKVRKDEAYANVMLFLLIYRIVGVILFLMTRNIIFLILFPNIFLESLLFYSLNLQRYIIPYVIIFKLIQELYIHLN
jgi:hypothetical protein